MSSKGSRDRMERVWERYRKQRDQETRDYLLRQNLALVHHFANRMVRSLGPQVEVEDLVSAGAMGLIKAVESFDPDRGNRFSTYAAPLIRGAMLDELRRRDRASRGVRKRERKLSDVEARLAARNGRKPNPTEVADELDIDVSTLWRWRSQIARTDRVSLDAEFDADGGSLAELIEDDTVEDVEDRIDRDERSALLRDALSSLGDRERLILTAYYFDGKKQREIADDLDLTESRISQLRTRAVASLRDRVDPALAIAA